MKKNVLFGVLGLVIIIGVGAWYYFYMMDNMYFSTDNAKVTADVYTITSQTAGKLVKYTVVQGSRVKENEVIARVENGPYMKSPIDGQVIKTDVTLNQMLSPGAVVAVVADTDNMFVNTNVEETDIVKIRVGQTAEVTIDAFPGRKFEAHVDEIDMTTQSALTQNPLSFNTSGSFQKVTQLIPVKIKIDEEVSLENFVGVNALVKIKVR